MNPLKKLQALNDDIRERQAALEEAEETRNKFFARYCKERPLKKREQDKLADHVEAGGALCCEDGARFLRDAVPAIWATLINDWAYEKLACQGNPSDAKEKAGKVRLLRRDEPPSGTPGYEIARAARKNAR
jgi:hypothetical protein